MPDPLQEAIRQAGNAAAEAITSILTTCDETTVDKAAVALVELRKAAARLEKLADKVTP